MPKAALTDRLLKSLRSASSQEEYTDRSFSVGGTFGVIVSPSGRKTFFHRYRIHGRKKRITLGIYPALCLAEARRLAIENQTKVNKGIDPAAEKLHYRKAERFSEVAEVFYQHHVLEHCKPSTAKCYRGMLDTDLLPRFGELKAIDVKRGDVIVLLDEISKGRGSPIMANRVRALISAIYNFAISRDIVDTNPVTGTVKPGRERRGERVLSTDEIFKLWQLLDIEHPVIAGVFRILLLTGQRPGEAMAMRWSDIDNDVWTIRSEVSKNRRVHRVHLTELALEVLDSMQPFTGHLQHVFSFSNDKPVIFIRRASRRLNRRMTEEEEPIREVGEDYEHWNPRDIRRTVQTKMAEIGIRPDIIDRVLNHNIRGVRAHYDHYNYYPEIREALERWGERVEQIVNRENESNLIQLYG